MADNPLSIGILFHPWCNIWMIVAGAIFIVLVCTKWQTTPLERPLQSDLLASEQKTTKTKGRRKNKLSAEEQNERRSLEQAQFGAKVRLQKKNTQTWQWKNSRKNTCIQFCLLGFIGLNFGVERITCIQDQSADLSLKLALDVFEAPGSSSGMKQSPLQQ